MDFTQQVLALADSLRTQAPIVHCITNFVTINDCANAALAIGASPIMADAPEEAAEITSHAQALVLNLGQLSPSRLEAMCRSGAQANRMGIPVVLDPVGVGASSFRADALRQLLDTVSLTILRCNRAEAAFLCGIRHTAQGIDSRAQLSAADSRTLAQTLAKQYRCTVAMTGASDLITDGTTPYRLDGGHTMLSRVTGMGCVATVLCAAYAAVSPTPLPGAAAGLGAIKAAGELAFAQGGAQGTGSFHIAVIDALSRLDSKILAQHLRLTEETNA